MRRISKKLFTVLAISAMILSSACQGKTAGDNANVSNTNDIKAKKTYAYDTEIRNYESVTSVRYELELLDDTNVKYREIDKESDTHIVIHEYDATYEIVNDQIRVNYSQDEYGFYDFSYAFFLENDQIVDVLLITEDTVSLEGMEDTYTCDSSMDGHVVLEIKRTGEAIVTFEDGTVVDGRIMRDEYSGRWELYAYDYTDDIDIDWFLDFEGNTFSYVSYRSEVYGEFAGIFELRGELGTFYLLVDNEGYACATINVDGMDVDLTGYISVDGDNITSAYLSGESYYDLTLDLLYVGDGVFEYSGSFRKPLALG